MVNYLPEMWIHYVVLYKSKSSKLFIHEIILSTYRPFSIGRTVSKSLPAITGWQKNKIFMMLFIDIIFFLFTPFHIFI